MDKQEFETLKEILRERENFLKTEVSTIKEVDEIYEHLCSSLNLKPHPIGRVLTKIGAALILFPAPFISELLGGIFLGTGLVVNRLRRPYLKEVGKEFTQSMKIVKLFREELKNMKIC